MPIHYRMDGQQRYPGPGWQFITGLFLAVLDFSWPIYFPLHFRDRKYLVLSICTAVTLLILVILVRRLRRISRGGGEALVTMGPVKSKLELVGALAGCVMVIAVQVGQWIYL